MTRRFQILLFLCTLASGLSAQDRFYDYYDNGVAYMEKKDWLRAIEEFKSAASLEYEDRHNKRTYGTRFIEYYPHRELGIAYYHLGEYENAKRELDLSAGYKNTSRTKEYMKKLSTIDFAALRAEADAKAKALREAMAEKEKKLKAEEERIAREEAERIQREKATAEKIKREREEKEKQERAERERIAREAKELADRIAKEAKNKAEKERLEKEARDREARLAAEKVRKAKEEADAERKRIADEDALRRKIEEDQKKFAEEKRKLEEEKNRIELNKKLAAANANKLGGMISAEALLYDPAIIPQVGSRLTLAVLPFEGSGTTDTKAIMTDKLITTLVQLRRFRVAERGAIDKVIREQDYQMTDFVEPSEAVKVGELAGADAIVIGNIKAADKGYSAHARVVDVTTGETIASTDVKLAGLNIQDLDEAAAQLAVRIYNDLPLTLGIIVNVDGFEEAMMDIGASNKVRKGMRIMVYREGDAIIHPVTKELLGKKITRLGEYVITDVQEKLTTGKMVKKEKDPVTVGDKVVVK